MSWNRVFADIQNGFNDVKIIPHYSEIQRSHNKASNAGIKESFSETQWEIR